MPASASATAVHLVAATLGSSSPSLETPFTGATSSCVRRRKPASALEQRPGPAADAPVHPPSIPHAAGTGTPHFRQIELRAKGMARFRRELPRRSLVSCRQGDFEEGNAAMDKAVRSPHEQLSPCKGGNDTALDPIGKNFANEFAQLSLEEEETDDVICGISENVVRDVGKAAIELLAARSFTVSELRKKLRSKNYPVDAIDIVVADFKSRNSIRTIDPDSTVERFHSAAYLQRAENFRMDTACAGTIALKEPSV